MWRNFTKSFERLLAITPRHFSTNSHLKWSGRVANVVCKNEMRSLSFTAALRNTVEAGAELTTAERDAGYIVPYAAENEATASGRFILETLRTRFQVSDKDAKRVLKDEEVARTFKHKSMMSTLDALLMEGVTKTTFIENPWIITMDQIGVIEKINVLKTIRFLRDINDFVPFLRVKLTRLRKVVSAMNQEANDVTYGNRVYYIAAKLDVPPNLVTKYVAKRLFLLEMPFDTFNTKLQLMINYKIEPESLLKDLWAFRYTPRAVEIRLRRAQQAKKDKIMPWMVRCTESILQKSLKLSVDELKVLKNKSSVAEYVGDRLGFSPEVAQAIMNRHPQVNRVRVTKIKEVLDYLLIEEKFSRHEIANVPRVLCHSLKTTKERIEELKKYNCRPSSLVIVCRSQREYDKFLNTWTKYNKFDTVEKNEEDINKENQP